MASTGRERYLSRHWRYHWCETVAWQDVEDDDDAGCEVPYLSRHWRCHWRGSVASCSRRPAPAVAAAVEGTIRFAAAVIERLVALQVRTVITRPNMYNIFGRCKTAPCAVPLSTQLL